LLARQGENQSALGLAIALQRAILVVRRFTWLGSATRTQAPRMPAVRRDWPRRHRSTASAVGRLRHGLRVSSVIRFRYCRSAHGYLTRLLSTMRAGWLRANVLPPVLRWETNMATTSAPSPIALGCPTCFRCSTRMLLTRIFPDRPGYNRHSYECPRCEYAPTEIVKLK
jgi:hypothetical protein